jgi:hypothetical protein
MKLHLAVSFLILLIFPFQLFASKPCESIQVPDSLLKQLKSKYPHERIVDDFSEDTIQNYFKGNPPCPGIIQADFDGNGEADWAFLLFDKKHKQAAIVAAFKNKEEWSLEKVDKFPCKIPPSNIYLEVIKPGTYEALDEVTAKQRQEGYRNKIVSTTQGILLQYVESDGVLIFRTKDGWIKIS